MSAAIDFSKPVQVRRGDFTPPEIELFRETLGVELYPFVKAISEGRISEDELMSSEHLPTLVGVVWIVMRREHPDLTYDEVYGRGIAEIAMVMQQWMADTPGISPPPQRQTGSQRRAARRAATETG